MSLAGLIRRRGSRATVYRPTGGRNADGSATVTAWAAVQTDLPVLLEGLTDELAQRLFGTREVIRDRGFVLGLPDLRPGDGLVVTAGRRVGQRFRVEEPLAYDAGSRLAHLEVALVSTTETIP